MGLAGASVYKYTIPVARYAIEAYEWISCFAERLRLPTGYLQGKWNGSVKDDTPTYYIAQHTYNCQ